MQSWYKHVHLDPHLKEIRNTKGTKAVVRRRERRRKSEGQGQVLLAQTSKSLPPLLLEREEEKIMMKIQRVYQKKGQEAELRPCHLDLIRNLKWLNMRSLHLTDTGLERGQLRGTIHLPLLDGKEMGYENAKHHVSTLEAMRKEERGEGREDKKDSLHHMMSR